MEYLTKLEDAFLNYEKLTAEEKEDIKAQIADNKNSRAVITDLGNNPFKNNEDSSFWKGYVKKQADSPFRPV